MSRYDRVSFFTTGGGGIGRCWDGLSPFSIVTMSFGFGLSGSFGFPIESLM